MSDRKNVLLIVVDQWRGDALPGLGNAFLKLPNIERLCREGVTFANHYSQSAPCGPARASLLTGLYQMTHRAVQNAIPLDSRFTNLGHELRRLGYDPALIGYTTTTPDPRTTGPRDPRFFGACRKVFPRTIRKGIALCGTCSDPTIDRILTV